MDPLESITMVVRTLIFSPILRPATEYSIHQSITVVCCLSLFPSRPYFIPLSSIVDLILFFYTSSLYPTALPFLPFLLFIHTGSINRLFNSRSSHRLFVPSSLVLAYRLIVLPPLWSTNLSLDHAFLCFDKDSMNLISFRLHLSLFYLSLFINGESRCMICVNFPYFLTILWFVVVPLLPISSSLLYFSFSVSFGVPSGKVQNSSRLLLIDIFQGISCVSITFVVISIICFCLKTHPSLR